MRVLLILSQCSGSHHTQSQGQCVLGSYPRLPAAVGVSFVVFFILNLLIWGQKSSGAVPFGTLFALCVLWFGISVPLVSTCKKWFLVGLEQSLGANGC